MFLASYLVNRLTGSPLLVQLVGAAFFAPMFLGGILGGVIADRFDRRRTYMTQLLALVPVSLIVGLVITGGQAQVWMVYPFMLAIGAGGLLDMTIRRTLVFDVVGAERVTNAMALETVSMTGGSIIGSLAAGALISLLGLGESFFVIAAVFALGWLCMAAMRPPPRRAAPTPGSMRRDIVEGLRFARGHRAIVGILGVTVLMNVFYFPYSPLVPVFADRLGVGAFQAGVLAGGAGIGALASAMLIAARSASLHRGWVYIGGTGVAMLGVCGFALAGRYPAALGALIVAGFGQSGFAAMQPSLMLVAAGPAMRGRVMGVLSMAIGALPFGMVLLGVAAQLATPQTAVAVSGALGLLALVLWAVCSPELRDEA